MAESSTREHLIAVGLQQIQKMGYASTGVKEILDLAGVPKGSFYHYFPSKEAFGKAVLESYLTNEAARAHRILNESKAAPLKRLRRYFEELISIYGPKGALNGGCLLGNLSQEMANQSDVMQRELHNGYTYWQATLEETLKEAVTRGDLPDGTRTADLAAFLLNSYEGALLRAKGERDEAPLRLFLQMAFGVLLVHAG